MRVIDLTLEPVFNLREGDIYLRIKNAHDLADELEARGWDEDQAWQEARAARNLPYWEHGHLLIFDRVSSLLRT